MSGARLRPAFRSSRPFRKQEHQAYDGCAAGRGLVLLDRCYRFVAAAAGCDGVRSDPA